MREVSNARKQAEKDAKKAERQAKKEAKAAERLAEKEAKDEARAQKKTEKSTEAKKARFLAKKARKKSANGFLAFRAAFLQTQLSISKPDGSKVRAGEVSKLAGAQWNTMPAESKAIWTQVAAQKLEQAQKAKEAKTHELDHLSTLLLHA